MPAAREPKYYTVKRHLLAHIESLEPGSPVPTERELATELETSRTTVRQALLELVAEGRLVRRQGSGTYVAEPKMDWPLHLTSFTEQAAANGFTASTQLLAADRIRADDIVAGKLDLEIGAGRSVWQIERLRLADDRPMAVETSHLSAQRFPAAQPAHPSRAVALRDPRPRLRRHPIARRGVHLDRARVDAGSSSAQHRHRCADARARPAQPRQVPASRWSG